ncbi:hypothetical protein [Wansuia hejianensis]|uniref:Membrane protein YkvI n=1 Tax=Wansuia hejianensis TaxID=2763667 RepID=A0A926EZI1_9FIRM|nr:hypothetical protein [Wansuia hejianensis]MBC8590402.1 hypothetical protein [Wansuia hejianensis]
MKKNKKNWLKIASIYVGTVIGAGFASGREIMEFFGVYGTKGIWGIYIAGGLFAIVGSLLLLKIYNNRINSIDGLVESLFGKKFGVVIDILIIISLYTGFSIMVAGSGAVFKEQLGFSFNIGIIFMIICSFIVFLFSLEGLSFINSILVPLIIIGILFTAYYIGDQEGYNFSDLSGTNLTKKGTFLTSALLYFGSNSLIIIVVFSSLLPMIDNKKTAILGGFTGGIILYFLGISILYSMLLYYNEVSHLDIPMLKICENIGETYRKLYGVILWISMFTTALANGFGFVNRVSKGKNKVLVSALFCISSIPLAKLGFANLVGVIYPIFGAIGFTMMVLILIW